jgi:hypothetical protein
MAKRKTSTKGKSPKGAKKYDWIRTPTQVQCFESSANMQTVKDFWGVGEAVPFHDESLSRATTEIQSILDKIAQSRSDSKIQLSIINVAGRPFLVWARSVARPSAGGIKSNADPARLVQSFKLRRPSGPLGAVHRTWMQTSDGHITCFASDASDCVVKNFWEVAEATPWHTDDLVSATKKIQDILDNVAKSNTDPNQHLAILLYDYRPLLAWVRHDGVSAYDDRDDVVRALRLR